MLNPVSLTFIHGPVILPYISNTDGIISIIPGIVDCLVLRMASYYLWITVTYISCFSDFYACLEHHLVDINHMRYLFSLIPQMT